MVLIHELFHDGVDIGVFLLFGRGSDSESTQRFAEHNMSRAEEHHWYDNPVPWSKEQLRHHERHHGVGLVQRSDIVYGGVPTRRQLEAMPANPRGTDVPLFWIRELAKARDMLDEATRRPDGSEHLIALIDSASDIEESAIKAFAS
jgi:hypothetical protein